MKRAVHTRSLTIGLGFVAILMAACTPESELNPFTSDGCSLFPDSSLINEDDWCSCCFEHDMAYWRGGTYEEREAADLVLKECILEKTGDKLLASTMYNGVRFGGSPYFYNWYRWGYGWGYDRKYQPLTADEERRADDLMEEYLASGSQAVCN